MSYLMSSSFNGIEHNEIENWILMEFESEEIGQIGLVSVSSAFVFLSTFLR